MPDRTISEEEFNFLQQKRVTADFVESIYNNPKLTGKAKALIKEAYPDLDIPLTAADVDRKIADQHTTQERQRQEAEARDKQKAEDEAWKTARAKAQKEYGLTDEGMTDLDKWMLDNKVGDYDVAASYRASKMPRPVEAYQDQFWSHDKAPGFKEIADDPEGWARKEILGTLYRSQDQMRRGG